MLDIIAFFPSWCSSSTTQPTYEAEEFTIWDGKSNAEFASFSLSDDLLPKRNDDDNRLQDAEVRKDPLPKILAELKDTGEEPYMLFSLSSPKPATFWEVLPPVPKYRDQRLDPSMMEWWQMDLQLLAARAWCSFFHLWVLSYCCSSGCLVTSLWLPRSASFHIHSPHFHAFFVYRYSFALFPMLRLHQYSVPTLFIKLWHQQTKFQTGYTTQIRSKCSKTCPPSTAHKVVVEEQMTFPSSS